MKKQNNDIQFFSCSVCKKGESYCESNLNRILSRSAFVLNHWNKQKGTFKRIKVKDIIFLKYNDMFIAFGEVTNIFEEDEDDGWNFWYSVAEWIHFDNKRIGYGPSTYGIGFEIIGGTNQSTVRTLSNKFGKLILRKFNSDHSLANKLIKNEVRTSRMAWNTENWYFPSGEYGKSRFKDTHEFKYSFGYEEWNFDRSKIIDGYHYGFLEPINKEIEYYENEIYDIILYSKNSVDKQTYIIGKIKNGYVLNEVESIQIYDIYKKNGWIDEMVSQVKKVNGNPIQIEREENKNLFNIRFKFEDLTYNGYVTSDSAELKKITRYTFLKENALDSNFKTELNFNPLDKEKFNKKNKVKSSNYMKEEKVVEITFKHKEMVAFLVDNLAKEYGFEFLNDENPLPNSFCKVDLVVKTKKSYIFYEVKAYNSIKISIRDALGQLLEYSYFSSNKLAEKIVIVALNAGDKEESIIYIRHIRNLFNLPIYLQIIDLDKKELTELY